MKELKYKYWLMADDEHIKTFIHHRPLTDEERKKVCSMEEKRLGVEHLKCIRAHSKLDIHARNLFEDRKTIRTKLYWNV